MPRRPLARLLAACVLCGVLAGSLVASAGAAPTNPLDECSSTGQLTQHYSVAVLRHALATMPANVKEYSDCYDVINRQLLAQLGGAGANGSGSGSGGSFLPTPVIVVLVLLLLAAATLGALAVRRRRMGADALAGADGTAADEAATRAHEPGDEPPTEVR